MILERYKGQLLVIHQAEHAAQAAHFAQHWKDKRTPSFTMWDAVIAAAACHDDGWIEWETHPSLDPNTGQPWQFYRLSPLEHIPLYRRGVAMAAERGAITALLVSMHAAGLYNARYGTVHFPERDFIAAEGELIREFLAEQADLQQSMAETALNRKPEGHISADPEIKRLYLLLQVWDRLSLQFAARLAADGDVAPLPSAQDAPAILHCKNRGDMRLVLDPYPFDVSPGIFPLQARLMPDRRYQNTEEFLSEMEKGQKITLACGAEEGLLR